MENRRKKDDRRTFRPTPAFPFADTHGCFLHESRSRAPDRRLNSLSAEWISMALVHDHLDLKYRPAAVRGAVQILPRVKTERDKIA
jgi:hypothetical protein